MKYWKVIAAAVCSVLVTSPSLADTRDDVLAGVARCGVIHDDRVWLDCVYGAQQPMRAKLGLSPAPELQQRLVPGVNVVPPPSQSLPRVASAPARPRKKPGFFGSFLVDTPDSQALRMASYRYGKNGAFVVELENGQEWEQTDITSGIATWDRPPTSYRVVINKGLLGNYNMRTTDDPHIYHVKRVR